MVELGIDEDGDAVTSCVVQEIDVAPKAVKLSPNNRAALDHLCRCLCDQGAPAPQSEHIPKGVQTVTLGAWKDYLFKAGIVTPEGSHREQFKRIRVTLQNSKKIGIWDDYVWSVT